MDEFYYTVNKHKVRLVSWNEARHAFLVLQENGVAQFIPERLLTKTDELVPEEKKNLTWDLTKA